MAHLVLTVALVVTGGCAPKAVDPSLEQPVEAGAPIVTTVTAHDEDAIVPFYTESEVVPERRFLAAPTRPESTQPTEKDAAGAATTAADGAVAATDGTTARRTSMPSRDPAGKKPARLGGVRKAVPVNRAAAALFGKWRIDTAQSTAGFVEADAILFLADGRMRTWKSGKVEDGRWTWTAESGIKTGGVDGVPISLGSFEVVAGTMTVSMSDEQRLVLNPDRLFVAPVLLLPQPAAP